MLHRTLPTSSLAAVALAAALMAVSAPALAQDTADAPDAPDTSDPQGQARGRVLFNEGVALFNKGDYPAACTKLEASLKQYAGIGTRGKLAECYEKLGRYASAWQAYREVAQLSARGGEARRERVANDRARALEPKLSYVTIVVPPGRDINGLVVKRGGEEVEHSALGSPVPVDSGTISVEVSAPGRKTFTRQLTASQGETVKFEVPILVPLPSSEPASATAPPPPPAGSSPEEPLPVQSDPPSWQKPLGVVLAGAGVVGLGVGAVFGLSAQSTYDGAFDGGGCDRATKTCDAPGQSAVDDARSKAALSTVLFGAGGALVVVGTVVFLTAPSSSRPRALRVAPTTYAGGGGITIGGAL